MGPKPDHSEEIDKTILRKYEVSKKLGKGVRPASCFILFNFNWNEAMLAVRYLNTDSLGF